MATTFVDITSLAKRKDEQISGQESFQVSSKERIELNQIGSYVQNKTLNSFITQTNSSIGSINSSIGNIENDISQIEGNYQNALKEYIRKESVNTPTNIEVSPNTIVEYLGAPTTLSNVTFIIDVDSLSTKNDELILIYPIDVDNYGVNIKYTSPINVMNSSNMVGSEFIPPTTNTDTYAILCFKFITDGTNKIAICNMGYYFFKQSGIVNS
jgi:hypothetical protein|nr:MAG TPA: hypothetical protein [Caudoviricetes sp.]